MASMKVPEKVEGSGYGVAAKLLVKMLAAAPALSSELADLLAALDDGETVYVEGVQDISLRTQLTGFLQALGLEEFQKDKSDNPTGKPQGFRARKDDVGVMKAVAELMDEHDLAMPPPLDRNRAFKEAQEVVEASATQEGMEGIRDEVPALLEQILAGELVMLEGIPDTKIRDTLISLFGALGLRLREGGEAGERGYGIPARGGDGSEAVVRRLMEEYSTVNTTEGSGNRTGVTSDNKGGAAVPTPRRGPIGPAMPSQAVLAQAKEAAAKYSQLQEELSSSDEDEVGPAVAGKAKRVAEARMDPNNDKRQRRKELQRAAEWEKVTGVITGGQAALDKEDANPGGREQWMLDPPKSLGVLGTLKTLQPTNRKFSTRSARGARAELHAPKAPKSKAELEAEAAAEELMAQHREARGASLVERHRADAAAAKKNEDGKAGKNKKWSWSREGDFEQRRRFTPQMYEELVQKSHELDSKFSRSISRTFL